MSAAKSNPTLKKFRTGIGIGGVLMLGGPLAGLVASIFLSSRAFDVGRIDPSEKARSVASGISEAINALALGGVVGLLGLLIAVTSLVAYSRTARANSKSPS